jgi:hypothetical protein
MTLRYLIGRHYQWQLIDLYREQQGFDGIKLPDPDHDDQTL